jgi:Lsr2
VADKTTVVKVDDLDPSIDDDVRTVTFAFDGTAYEIDLGRRNREALAAAFAPYVGAARPTRGPRATTRRAPARAEAAAIRAWAADQGVELMDRGRIPARVSTQYENRRPH